MSADEIVKVLRRNRGECNLADVQICMIAADLIEQQQARVAELEKQLVESQRRKQAVVEDLRKNRARKCDCCVYAGRSERWPCVDCQSPISNYGDGWKWRGTQEAGKGEAK